MQAPSLRVMASPDLFSHAVEQHLSSRAPLAARLRPRNLNEVVGQQHLVGPHSPLRVLIESDQLTSVVLWGPPGTGKTSIAQLLASHTAKTFEQLSAVSATVGDVRGVIAAAAKRLGEHGGGTMLFLDEIHRFNKAQQDALLPAVEDGLVVLVGATTENPYFELNAPLLSRSTLFRLEPLDTVALSELVRRGLDMEGVVATDDTVALMVDRAGGDGRQVLTSLNVAMAIATERTRRQTGGESVTPTLTPDDVEGAIGATALRYGRDDH